MFAKIFYTVPRVVFLILFLFCFFDFSYLPVTLSLKSDPKLFYVLVFLLVLGIGSYKHSATSFSKRINYLFAFLFVFAIVNCISCYYYRHQAPWITFIHWSPIFLIFLYYPFSTLHLSIQSWERILFSLFVIEMIAELIQSLFPDLYLFNMTSSLEKFEREFRVRLYGNAILYMGSLFCLNKALVLDEKKLLYWMMYLLSLALIFLGGYRIVMFANLFSSFVMFYRLKKIGVNSLVVVLLLLLLLLGYGIANTSIGELRTKELIERNANANFENDDYVRVITLNYYFYNYFKSPVEMALGSGMVKRSFSKDNDFIKNSKYESNYSREVSDKYIRYHIAPIDWGLLGFSWEGGMPATIILIFIALMLIISKTDNKYMYLSAWGIFVLLFSLTNGRYYSHHNLIYTAILLVICDRLQKVKIIERRIRK